MLAASAAFKAAPNATAAADVVGAMLTRWHYIALAAPLVLFVFETRRVRRAVLVILFLAVIFAAAQVFVDLRIREIRWASPIAISSLPVSHPTRRTFGALHGVSMSLLALQALAAALVVLANPLRKVEEGIAMSNEPEDNTIYQVVVNHEEQYSIWPADRELPLGWSAAGFSGTKQQCLAYIEQVWTDMRPLSLRQKMDGQP